MMKKRNTPTFARAIKLYSKDVTITLIPLTLLILLKGLSNLMVLKALMFESENIPHILLNSLYQ